MGNDRGVGYYKDGYGTDTGEYDTPEGRISGEPAPRQYLPRIITGTGVKGDTSGATEGGSTQQESKESIEGDANEGSRDTWDNPREFLLSCISMSVGIGNIWRFPAAAATNGGGAFLIPYLVVLLLIGRPLYYLEMCLGQFSHYGPVKVWNMVPLFKGVGYGAAIAIISACSYGGLLMAITTRFFVSSFSNPLPWAECHQDKHPMVNCSDPHVQNDLAAFYFLYTANPQRPDINDGLGKIHWQLLLGLIFTWFVAFLSLIKGIKSSGKVAYFTAIFPYIVLFILLIRGVTLKGAWKGIKIFLEPKWIEITKPKVWYAAVEQCFFSLNVGFGTIVMFSSYNSFRQNVYKDALIISCLDTLTSFVAGITVFAVIGNLMEQRGVGIDQISGVGGAGLAFIVYPQAIASFDWAPQLFAVLFFLMLFTLGVGSAIPVAGSVTTILCDQYPHWKRWFVALIVCSFGCLSGLLYVTEGGLMMLELVDHFGVGKVIYIMVIVECAAISYVYGLDNFCNDIHFMLGRRIGPYWRFCWGFFIPVGLSASFIYYLATAGEFKSSGVAYPTVATVCGWAWFAIGVGMIPGWAVHTVVTWKAPSWKEKFHIALQPTKKWGPQGATLRKEWLDHRARQDAKGRKRFYIF